jgi:dipeptidase E
VKLLLTSGGITNPSIHDTLVDLLGKPIAESNALCVPTAIYAFPGGAVSAYKLVTGSAASPLCGLGWKSLGILELTALPSIETEHWTPVLQETDALLVGGGDPLYLSYWMQQSGLVDMLPSLRRMVYVGVSAGSLVMGPWVPGGDRALGMVDFSIFPHLDHPDMPDFSMANAEEWAAKLSGPGYAADDQTAIRVVDGAVEVISEGHWKLFTTSP